MDPVKLKEMIAIIQAKRKASVPWPLGEPYDQPYYGYHPETETWEEVTSSPVSEAPAKETLATFTVLSWNIDFMLIHPNERIKAALEHLSTLINISPHP